VLPEDFVDRLSLGDATHVGNTYIKARNLMPEKRLSRGKITMELRFSGFTSNGEDAPVCHTE
jgi:hypothetical protein